MNSNDFNITDIIIQPAKSSNGSSHIKAHASVVFNNLLRVNGLSIIQDKAGIRISYKDKNLNVSGFWQLLQSMNKELYFNITCRIVNKYNLGLI